MEQLGSQECFRCKTVKPLLSQSANVRVINNLETQAVSSVMCHHHGLMC